MVELVMCTMNCKGCGIKSLKEFCSKRCKDYGHDTTIHSYKNKELKVKKCKYCDVTFKQYISRQYTCGDFDCIRERRRECTEKHRVTKKSQPITVG